MSGTWEWQSGGDLERMLALVRAFPHHQRHVIDLPYRLCSPSLDRPENVRHWLDAGGSLLAWAAWQQPFITLDYALHPQASAGLEEEIVLWGIRRFEALARERGRVLDYVIDAREDDLPRRALLERHGFRPSAHWRQHHLRRALREPVPPAPLPAGFALRPLAGVSEVAAAVALHRAAFESENMTEVWRLRIVRSPHYSPNLDVVATAPNGRLAAFCLCWLDRTDAGRIAGQVEPLGVHPAFKGLGLGRAVLLEGLRRMREAGAAEAHIEVDSVNAAARRLYTVHGAFTPLYTALKFYRAF